MEKITSRKNSFITHTRALATDSGYRDKVGEYLCDGVKTLREALCFGAEICAVLWKGQPADLELGEHIMQYYAAAELFDYASPLNNSPGPLFTVKMPDRGATGEIQSAVVLERVQDPGNVGTVIRTANAFQTDAVILTGDCADLYNPKTVRATMGAIFRQKVLRLSLEELPDWLKENKLALYGAALSPDAEDIRRIDLKKAAVAIGSEGSGLSAELLRLCRAELIIPMNPRSESLNAGVAASVVMWEMARERL